MPSSYTASLRFELQFTGENVNLWGEKLNAALTRADSSIAGWLTKALTGDYTLTSANGSADEARSAMLKFTGTGTFTVTIPAVSKRYDVWNACTGDLTLSNGSASVVVKAGEVVSVVTDGNAGFKRVLPTDFGGATLTNVARVSGLSTPSANSDAATKKYVDDTAFSAAAGNLPGQEGSAGKFLGTDGTVAGWEDPFASPTIATPTITTPAVTGGMSLAGSTKQNVEAVASTSIDLSASDFFTKSISGDTTFTFANATASKGQAFALKLTISSAAVPAWPAAVDWATGSAPTLGNGTHILGFVTFDGGTSWVGILAAFNVS